MRLDLIPSHIGFSCQDRVIDGASNPSYTWKLNKYYAVKRAAGTREMIGVHLYREI